MNAEKLTAPSRDKTPETYPPGPESDNNQVLSLEDPGRNEFMQAIKESMHTA